MALVGFLEPNASRMSATIDTIEREPSEDGLVFHRVQLQTRRLPTSRGAMKRRRRCLNAFHRFVGTQDHSPKPTFLARDG